MSARAAAPGCGPADTRFRLRAAVDGLRLGVGGHWHKWRHEDNLNLNHTSTGIKGPLLSASADRQGGGTRADGSTVLYTMCTNLDFEIRSHVHNNTCITIGQ